MDILLPVFQLLYFAVHFVYSLAEGVADSFYELYHIIQNILWYNKNFVPDSHRLWSDVCLLKRVPQHLGLIFMPKQHSNYLKISHLIYWSTTYGINYISLFDSKGDLKNNVGKLLPILMKVSRETRFRIIIDGAVLEPEQMLPKATTSNNSEIAADQAYVNDISLKKMNRLVTLNILSTEDGKENIVNIAQKLSLLDSSVNFESIHSLTITSGQPDPDLVLIIGTSCLKICSCLAEKNRLLM